VKFLQTCLSILFLLLPLVVSAQPRVEEERPLVRAVNESNALVRQRQYALAINTLEAALDSVDSGQDRSDALYLLSDANFLAGRYRSALIASRDFLFQYPDDARTPEVLYMRGVAGYQEGETEEAEESFHEALARATYRSAEAQYWIARINAERGRLDTAEIYAWQSLSAPPHEFSDDALYLTGWIYEGKDSIDIAAEFYRRLLEKFPESDLALDAQLRLGVIEARRGYNESAYRLLLSFTPRSERQSEERTFYLAEVTSAMGRHEDALKYYTDFLREFPSSPRIRSVRYGAGWSQQQLGRYDDAINSFRTVERGVDSIAAAATYQIGAIQTLRGDTAGAMRTFHDLIYRLPYESFSDNAYYQLGRIHYRRENYDSSRHYFLIVARQFPESDVRKQAYYLLGESYAALGDFSNAEYAFARTRKVGAERPLYERALYREGVMLYKIGRFTSAIDRLRQYVADYEKGADIDDATFWLGEALYQARAYDEAERYYASVIERFPNSSWRSEALYGLAWARFQQKDFKGAAQTFDDYIRTYPKSDLAVEATLRLADSYRLMGNYDQALKTYQSIGSLAGKGIRDEEARFRLTEVFLQMNDPNRAVETFRGLIRDYPNSTRRDAYAYNIGVIYHEHDMDSLAIDELKRFLVEYPESQLQPQAHFTIGDAYYNRGEFDSAYAYYSAVLDRFPASTIVPDALDQVRFTLEALGRGRDAVAVIDSFMAKNPNRLPADSLSFKKAAIVFEGGDYAESIALYRKMILDYPESLLHPDALYQIGRSYEYMGQIDSALTTYGEVVSRYPQSDAAELALIEQGELRLRGGIWSQAVDNFSLFITRFPESNRVNEARYGLGQARLALGDTVGAFSQFSTVLDSATSGEEDVLFTDKSRLALARIYVQRNRIDSALDLLAAVVARRLDDIAAEGLLLRGQLLTQVNDLSSALAELRRLTTDFTSYPEYSEPGMLQLGIVYELLTNYAAARDIYTQLISQTQDPTLKAQAEGRLKKLKK